MKGALNTLLVAVSLAGVSHASVAFNGTCASVEECGVPENPPYYYDWTYKPSSMYWITRIAYFQSFLVPFIYLLEIFNEYRAINKKDPNLTDDLKDIFELAKKPQKKWLDHLEKVSLAH